MRDVKEKISYIYYSMDGIYYFISNQGISDHSKRCFLRRFFILLDAFLVFIGNFKNELYKSNKIDIKTKKVLEEKIRDLEEIWKDNYETIRNKLSAHQQKVESEKHKLERHKLLEWWNEIDYTTIGYFYEVMREIRSILTDEAKLISTTPVDYEEIDFSDTILKEQQEYNFYLAIDRLGKTKKNSLSITPLSLFEEKCMLILSIVDFIFINSAITKKAQNYETYYKSIIFDSAWLLLACDTVSLVDNLYESNDFGQSLIELSTQDWPGKEILEKSNVERDFSFETKLIELRNKLGAHVDTTESLQDLLSLFEAFDLKELHDYFIVHIQAFQQACNSDVRTRLFSLRDQQLSGNILKISATAFKSFDG